MSAANKRRLSLEEAAKLIFDTASPTPQQIGKVRNLIARGILAGTTEGRCSTSTEAVAHYLATAAMYHGGSQHKSSALQAEQGDGKSRRRVGDHLMRPLYSDMMKDYFLAVVRRRDARRRSAGFQRAVLAGQLLGLVAVFALCLWLVIGGFGSPAELRVVENYLAGKFQDLQIESWGAPKPVPDGSISLMRVKYSYAGKNGKRATADSLFSIQGNRVISSTSAGR